MGNRELCLVRALGPINVSGFLVRNNEAHPGFEIVRIADCCAVGVINLFPVFAVPVNGFGNFPECVAFFNLIGRRHECFFLHEFFLAGLNSNSAVTG